MNSASDSGMSAPASPDDAAAGEGAAAAAGTDAPPNSSGRGKRAARPSIDLDDEIRRANDLAAMSRKMLTAARNVSRNNKTAKQRLIKKAGKLSPEDLERIAVLKRCGLFEEGPEDEAKASEAEGEASKGSKKGSTGGPSLAESKRPKVSSALGKLSKTNPIMGEIGLGNFGGSSASSGPSVSSGKQQSSTAKVQNGAVLLGPRGRLPRAPSGLMDSQDSQVTE